MCISGRGGPQGEPQTLPKPCGPSLFAATSPGDTPDQGFTETMAPGEYCRAIHWGRGGRGGIENGGLLQGSAECDWSICKSVPALGTRGGLLQCPSSHCPLQPSSTPGSTPLPASSLPPSHPHLGHPSDSSGTSHSFSNKKASHSCFTYFSSAFWVDLGRSIPTALVPSKKKKKKV